MMRRTVVLLALMLANSAEGQMVGEVFRDCAICPEMVVVPAGTFMMGSPESEERRWSDEGPRHVVTIESPFAVGVFEVTFAEWDACVEGGGCGGYRPVDEGWGREDRPVINVSWQDAQEFARWLSRETGELYRLLSEAEWEYVARAGTRTARYWGESEAEQCAYTNGRDATNRAQRGGGWAIVECSDGYAETAPVGMFGANRYGLYDTLGNVWEWTEDCWHRSYVGAPRDAGVRGCRGGIVLIVSCAAVTGPTPLGTSASAIRGSSAAERRRDGHSLGVATSVGFRLARNIR